MNSMWPTFKESISNALHPGRWSKLNPPQRYDVVVLWLSFIGIAFTMLVLYYSYVQAQEENFEKTTGLSKFNITEVHFITKHVTIFTIRDSETNTEYILYDHSNGMFDNQAVLLDIKKGKGGNK